MASSQSLYSITITNGNTNSAPQDGFVDNLRVEQYGLPFETAFFTASISSGANTRLIVSAITSGYLTIGSVITGLGVTGSGSVNIIGYVGPIASLAITSGHAGTSYAVGDLFNIGGGGSNAIGIVTSVSGGAVTGASVIGIGAVAGTGYINITGQSTTVNTGSGDGTLEVNITVQVSGGVGTYILSQGTSGGVSSEAMTGTPGLTYALSLAKRRGNVRYREIIDQLGLVANLYVAEQAGSTAPNTVSNATALTEATSFQFWVIAEHGPQSLITLDELNPGQYLTNTACIQRCVARALVADIFKKIDVYDPTSSTSTGSYGSTTSIPRFGTRIIPSIAGDNSLGIEIGAYSPSLVNADSLVAVVQITF